MQLFVVLNEVFIDWILNALFRGLILFCEGRNPPFKEVKVCKKLKSTPMSKKVRSGLSVFRNATLAVIAGCGLLAVCGFTGKFSMDRIATAYVPGFLVLYENCCNTPQEDKVYTEVKNPPAYPGGNDAMQKFIIDNIKYPADCKKSGTQGTVYVDFVIDKNGLVKSVKVKKPLHPSLDNEAIRIVKLMPAWTPGTNDAGKAVKVAYTLHIKFALK